MAIRLRILAPLLGAAALLLPGRGSPQTPAQDPFAAGLRWRHSAFPPSAWLPSSLAIGAGGAWVWAAGSGTAPHWMLLPAQAPAAGGPLVRFADPGKLAWLGTLKARAPAQGTALFAAAAHKAGAGASILVARYDALASAAGAPFEPVWTHDMQLAQAGAFWLEASRDGSLAVCAAHEASSGRLRVDWIDGSSGRLLARRDLASSTLRRASLSSTGSRLALVAGTSLWVLDASGATVYTEQLAQSTNALALSGDGQTLLVGAGGSLRVLVAAPGEYRPSFSIAAAPGELAARAGVSDDGRTCAVGWWDSIDGSSVRLEVWDAGGVRLTEIDQPAAALAPQNFPEVAIVSPDGRRAAFGLWGAGDPRPEVILYDRDLNANVMEVDLPGSVLSMDLDPEGRRLAVGMKHVHAGSFGGTGDVLWYDTGECDLAMLAPPRAGRGLPLAALRPGARAILFLVGTPAPAPGTLPGASGSLWLDRGAPMRVFRIPASSAGRADMTLYLEPNLYGAGQAIQALARSGGQVLLSECVLLPVVL